MQSPSFFCGLLKGLAFFPQNLHIAPYFFRRARHGIYVPLGHLQLTTPGRLDGMADVGPQGFLVQMRCV